MSTQTIAIIPNPIPTAGQPGAFTPQAAVCCAYDTITWYNADSQAHWPAPNAATPTAWFQYQIPPGGTSDTLAPGPNTPATASYTLNYVCVNHPEETGTITVNPQP